MKNLYVLRKSRNLTLQKLADKLGVTAQTISNWENGFNEPNIDKLIEIANYFNVSVDYLIANKFNPLKELYTRLKSLDEKSYAKIIQLIFEKML
jgi:transcriptional regulator with XRE-family HTH domain